MRQLDDTQLNLSVPAAEDVTDLIDEPPASAFSELPSPRLTLNLFARLKRNNTLAGFLRDEMHRRTLILERMVLVVSVALLVVGVLTLTLHLFSISALIAVGVGFTLMGIVYGLVRLQRLELAGTMLVAGTEGILMISCWDTTIELPELTINYTALTICVVLAGIIINEYAPFIAASIGLVVFGGAFMVYASRGHDNELLIEVFVIGAVLNYVLATMAWINARTINQAIGRMSWQNQELLKVNNQLEQNLQADLQAAGAASELAEDLSKISYDQSERAQGQAQSVAIVTSTLEELSATARQIAEVAESVFTATEQALRTAEVGGQSVGLSIDSIATLTGQVETISAIANDLGNQSRRIGEIVETISELAEETNLLALNATIEAAGAGEYGRRFQVVASEVQLLANRSRTASRDVQAILGQIRTSINNTLQATNEGLEEARRMSEVAGEAGEAIEQIIETVESTTFLARQINLTTQQQRSATDQAVDMIRQVAGDSRESAARAQQLLSASDRLSETAISLRRD